MALAKTSLPTRFFIWTKHVKIDVAMKIEETNNDC